MRAHQVLAPDLLLNLVLLLSGSAGALFAQFVALGAQRNNAGLVGVELLALLRCGLKQGHGRFLAPLGVKRLNQVIVNVIRGAASRHGVIESDGQKAIPT